MKANKFKREESGKLRERRSKANEGYSNEYHIKSKATKQTKEWIRERQKKCGKYCTREQYERKEGQK